ncbi:MAG: RING finger protein [Oscillospiraceae bacterium]|nr:RING finger protein [Oscillospiraceae bacterium]
MKYENETCLACNKVFEEGDDIVVCPECGTPHHRDCYNKLGHCVNKIRHSEGYSWLDENRPNKDEEKKSEKSSKERLNSDDVSKVFPGGFISNDEAPNGAMPAMEVDRDGNAHPVFRTITGKEKIGEYTVEAYGNVIQKNKHKFIPKFMMMERSNRKWTWNWAGFFFGPFWLMYRKMYKLGIIAMLISIIIPICFIGEISEYGTKYSEVYTEAAEIMLSDANQSTEELNSKVDALAEKMPPQPVCIQVSNYIQFAVDLVIAVFGNYLYKEHCVKILTKSKKILEDGNSEEQEKFLRKRGGRSIVPVVLLFFGMTLITNVAALIFVNYNVDIATLLRRLL